MNVFGFLTPFDNFGVKLLTIALIIGLSYINYIGLTLGENFSRFILYIVLSSLFLITVLGFTLGHGSWTNIQTNSSSYVAHNWTDSIFIKSMFAALLSAFWGYEGWSTIGYLGGEIKNAQRNLPLALILGMLFVIVIYFGVNLTYLYVMPIDQLVNNQHSQNTIAAVIVVKTILGNGGGIIISLLILITTLGCTNTTILAAPRLYFAMAREGLFFKSAGDLHPIHNTPSKAFIYQAVVVSLLVISGSFDQLTDMLIFASFIFYGATTLGVFILRKKMPDTARPYKTWGYPIVPAIFILFCVALVVITFAAKPREALMGLGLMLLGVPFYFYWNKKSAH
jgi:APA family basic amino acid/polyamine antiporter